MSARLTNLPSVSALTSAVATNPAAVDHASEQAPSFGAALDHAQQAQHAESRAGTPAARQPAAQHAALAHPSRTGSANRRTTARPGTSTRQVQDNQPADTTAMAEQASVTSPAAPSAPAPKPIGRAAEGATPAVAAAPAPSRLAPTQDSVLRHPEPPASADQQGDPATAAAAATAAPAAPGVAGDQVQATASARGASAPTVTVTSSPAAPAAAPAAPPAAQPAAGLVLDQRAAAALPQASPQTPPQAPLHAADAGGQPAPTVQHAQTAPPASAQAATRAPVPAAAASTQALTPPAAALPAASVQSSAPSAATQTNDDAASAPVASPVKAADQHLHAPAPQAQPLTSTSASTVSTGDRRDAATDQQAGDNPSQERPSGQSHGHDAGSPTMQSQPAPYAVGQDRAAANVAATPQTTERTDAEVPATQALPAGTLQQVNGDEHSVRVQLHTDVLGRLTADLHTRPGEMAVQLSVPDDTGRAIMAQRMDALRDSLGQSGTAVHLSLTAQDNSSSPQQYQGSTSQGQQGNTPREGRAPALSAPQPHDAVTPRATDGSSALPAPAGNRLVDVRA